MNGFTVWDNIFKVFLNPDNIFINSKGNIYNIEDGDIEELSNSEHSLHKNIGLKDTNGKSIYENSSIVKLGKDLGFIKYSPFLSANVFICLSSHKIEQPLMECNLFNINNMEIIDTIQENKLGLIK